MVRKFPIECVLHSRCPVVTDTGWPNTVAIVGITSLAWAWELREPMKYIFQLLRLNCLVIVHIQRYVSSKLSCDLDGDRVERILVFWHPRI